jgi:hypothetical protein
METDWSGLSSFVKRAKGTRLLENEIVELRNKYPIDINKYKSLCDFRLEDIPYICLGINPEKIEKIKENFGDNCDYLKLIKVLMISINNNINEFRYTTHHKNFSSFITIEAKEFCVWAAKNKIPFPVELREHLLEEDD